MRTTTIAVVVALLATLLVTSGAVAQQQDEQPDMPFSSGFDVMSDEIFSSSTSSTSTTMTVGLGFYALQLASGHVRQTRAYVRQNRIALQHDLHTGDGTAIRDLAYLFGVESPYHDAFAEVAYERRDRLTPLVDSTRFDTTAARRFVAIVVDGMAERPELADPARQLSMQLSLADVH